jgi:hypothetical protein
MRVVILKINLYYMSCFLCNEPFYRISSKFHMSFMGSSGYMGQAQAKIKCI